MWLGRLIDKARRWDAVGLAPGRMDGEYMFGDNDYLDAKLLHFLGLKDAQVCEIVRAEPNDERAAQRIVETSGKTAEQCSAFNRAFIRSNGPFLTMIDLDEGRRSGGMGASLMKAVYNGVIFPFATVLYRSAARKQQKGATLR